jgi:FlaA1/EpsC-like NDP-sugar epimerase
LIQQRFRIAAAAHLFGDLAATALAFFGAWALRFELEVVPLTKNPPDLGRYVELLPVALVLFPVVFYFHGLYRQRLYRARVDETVSVLLAVILGTVLLSGITSWYRPALSPGSISTSPIAALLASSPPSSSSPWSPCASRSAACCAARACTPAISSESWWSAPRARHRHRLKLVAHRDFGVEVIGFLDDDPAKRPSCAGLPVLGETAELQRVIDENRIDQVFIALPLAAHKKMMTVLQTVGSEVRRGQAGAGHPPVRHDQGDARRARRHADHQSVPGASAGLAQLWSSACWTTFSAAGLLCCCLCFPSSRCSSGRRPGRSSTARSAWGSTGGPS